MKKSSLVLVILLMGLDVFAQENQSSKKSVESNPLRNEVGINLFSLTYQFDNLPGHFVNVISGIYYKYHFGQNALRFSFDHQGNVNQISPAVYSGFVQNTEHFKLGYQRSFGHKRLSPFVYVDGYAAFIHHESTSWDRSYNYLLTGGATGGGLRYKLNSRIALSYEFAILCAWDKNYHNYSLSAAYFTFCPIKQLGISFLF